jgi:hypothetical protein
MSDDGNKPSVDAIRAAKPHYQSGEKLNDDLADRFRKAVGAKLPDSLRVVFVRNRATWKEFYKTLKPGEKSVVSRVLNIAGRRFDTVGHLRNWQPDNHLTHGISELTKAFLLRAFKSEE